MFKKSDFCVLFLLSITLILSLIHHYLAHADLKKLASKTPAEESTKLISILFYFITLK